jgi:predicted enzyme related to lactoylglutathione lyase
MGQPVTAWQIVTSQPDKLEQFYTTLFGWEVNANNALGYRMIDSGSERGINGGIWPAPPNVNGFVQLFVEVDDVSNAANRAVELGANILVPPQKLPDGDEMAVLQDPAGIAFGLKRAVAD